MGKKYTKVEHLASVVEFRHNEGETWYDSGCEKEYERTGLMHQYSSLNVAMVMKGVMQWWVCSSFCPVRIPRGSAPVKQEESKETGGFVAHNFACKV